MRNHWRRFLPKHKQAVKRGVVVDNELRAMRTLDDLNTYIEALKARPVPHHRSEAVHYYRSLLLAQTPRAVMAQWQMDAHKHGYHNRDKRLYELIDFNDSFVSLMIAAGPLATQAYVAELKVAMDKICRQLHNPAFSVEQFDAIVRGLGREIAVYRAAQQLGFGVQMTSRTEDAFGIDMVITHPETGRTLNIDCKTPSSFRHRLEDLVKHKRITDAQLLKADEEDFITIEQRRGAAKVPVTLLCIRPETLGEVHDFMFDAPSNLEDLLNKILATSSRRTKN